VLSPGPVHVGERHRVRGDSRREHHRPAHACLTEARAPPDPIGHDREVATQPLPLEPRASLGGDRPPSHLRLAFDGKAEPLYRRADRGGAIARLPKFEPKRGLARFPDARARVGECSGHSLGSMADRGALEGKTGDAVQVGVGQGEPGPTRGDAPREGVRGQVERGGAERGGRCVPQFERGARGERQSEERRREPAESAPPHRAPAVTDRGSVETRGRSPSDIPSARTT